MEKTKQKTARFEARIPQTIKERIETAAALGGYKSISEFVIRASEEKAEQVIDKHKRWILSKRDSELLADLLQNPPEPNLALVNLLSGYRKKYIDIDAD
jgi:uncharacterized protein (DUF1778 family)